MSCGGQAAQWTRPAAALRARERIAAQRAARKRAEARRRFFLAVASVTAVLAITVALAVIKLTSTGGRQRITRALQCRQPGQPPSLLRCWLG